MSTVTYHPLPVPSLPSSTANTSLTANFTVLPSQCYILNFPFQRGFQVNFIISEDPVNGTISSTAVTGFRFPADTFWALSPDLSFLLGVCDAQFSAGAVETRPHPPATSSFEIILSCDFRAGENLYTVVRSKSLLVPSTRVFAATKAIPTAGTLPNFTRLHGIEDGLPVNLDSKSLLDCWIDSLFVGAVNALPQDPFPCPARTYLFRNPPPHDPDDHPHPPPFYHSTPIFRLLDTKNSATSTLRSRLLDTKIPATSIPRLRLRPHQGNADSKIPAATTATSTRRTPQVRLHHGIHASYTSTPSYPRC
ncbi:hypothetical protein BDK51DRAFT_33556 [Blyttiomyces helicus]|uniref:Uncharacterized protein n=1 Tax=Blyttiomyces helicus TaxID=388810 RepID=A0A4P9W227_9FUNG|nr:hypothetical protein BDK51DRAFT_33556 [Blyttiomyces helicus]|eukprot:RKO86259.1 hypothetical protein BDK51DRAFT_33556 [Blyttiomyces helicus]